MKNSKLFIIALFVFLSPDLFAQLSLPAVLSNNMVLQRNSTVKLWGWASPDETVKISVDWVEDSYLVKADRDGKWQAEIQTGEAGEAHQIVFEAANKIVLDNVLFGEVWVCSGQSNMEFTIKMLGGWDSDQYAKSKEKFQMKNYSHIRLFDLKNSASDTPMDDCEGSWELPTLEKVEIFSAVAWFFGVELLSSVEVPIGLISTNWGGTPAEAWTSEEELTNNPELEYYSKENLGKRADKNTPSMLYNAMINPILNYGIRGVIWYQGESNRNDAFQYRSLFPAMIKDWRKNFAQGDFPFYYVQIAPFNYNENLSGALIREAQLMSLSVANTGMVVCSDIGNINDIHPKNKQEVGRRLALNALHSTYGFDYLEYSGPIYKSMEIIDYKGGRAIKLAFDHAESGLLLKGKELSHFTIAGPNRRFISAKAEIVDNHIIVSSSEQNEPIAVRFAFGNTDEPNLFNSAGLPASCFRTDSWIINTSRVSISKEDLKKRNHYKITMSSKDSNAEIRYTMDGTIPQLTSKIYKKAIRLKGTATLRARAFINDIGSENTTSLDIPVNED